MTEGRGCKNGWEEESQGHSHPGGKVRSGAMNNNAEGSAAFLESLMEQTGPLLRLYFYTLSLTFKALDYKDKIFPKYTTLNVQEKSVGFDSSIQSTCACFYVIFFFLLITIFP